jgi:hypothetical protein
LNLLRKKRGLAALGALVAVIGLTLGVVLPALGATSTGFSGAISSPQAVSPTYVASGGENDCALFTAKGATAVGTGQYFVSNPKSIAGKTQTVTTNGVTVTFTVNVDKTYTYLSFSVTGAIVTDVGIKGGNGTDWYSYESATGGGVTHDAGLTAPSQSAINTAPYYALSQTVFCYTPKITCQPGVPLSDPQHPGETIELPSCAGKDNVFFDFNAGAVGGKSFVSVYTYGGSGTPNTPMVEHITGTLSGSTQPTIQYSDTNPAGTLHDMRYCRVDPRDAGSSDLLALASQYQSIGSKSSVLPAADPTNDPEDSSCLIATHTWIDSNGHVQFEAYVYTDIDGYRTY